MELIIGPRLFSTWSLRAWLVLRRADAAFATREVWYPRLKRPNCGVCRPRASCRC